MMVFAYGNAQSRQRRQRQIGGLIQQELSDLLKRELHDPRLGFATVTEVKMRENLNRAQVYISVMGDEEERQKTMAALGQAAGFIRRELASRLKLRYMPQIEFVPDLSLDRAARLEALLDKIHEETSTGDESQD